MNHDLKLDLDIYPVKYIFEAAAAYREIATIDIKIVNSYAECDIVTSIYDYKETAKEYANYVLGLTVKHLS